MSMETMAREYKESADKIRTRINELKRRASSPRISPDERYSLKCRIVDLETIMADTLRTAYALENYYDGRVSVS